MNLCGHATQAIVTAKVSQKKRARRLMVEATFY